MWKEYNRVIKENGVIVLTAQTPFDKILANSNLKMLRYEWIWEKITATGHLNSNRMPMKAHENVLVFFIRSCRHIILKKKQADTKEIEKIY